MADPGNDELDLAIRACQAASEKMLPKRSFRLRTLLQMVRNELEKERALRSSGATNGSKEQPNGNH